MGSSSSGGSSLNNTSAAVAITVHCQQMQQWGPIAEQHSHEHLHQQVRQVWERSDTSSTATGAAVFAVAAPAFRYDQQRHCEQHRQRRALSAATILTGFSSSDIVIDQQRSRSPVPHRSIACCRQHQHHACHLLLGTFAIFAAVVAAAALLAVCIVYAVVRMLPLRLPSRRNLLQFWMSFILCACWVDEQHRLTFDLGVLNVCVPTIGLKFPAPFDK
jgi:hypothetical protein